MPDVVTTARPLSQVPLAVLMTANGDATALVAELTATTRRVITTAAPTRP